MVSPYLHSKKYEEQSITVSDDAKRIFQAIYNKNKPGEKEEKKEVIEVSELISKMAFFYEKLRNAVDYDEEHLLRKNAIFRFLKRQVIIEGVIKTPDSQYLADHLLKELIRASYLPNEKVPAIRVKQVELILKKYFLLKSSQVKIINHQIKSKARKLKNRTLKKEKTSSVTWLLSLAASEIEELLGKDLVKSATVTSLFNILKDKIILPENYFSEKDLKLQIYLSICRNYLKFDNDMLSLVIFKYYNAGWSSDLSDYKQLPTQERIDEVALKLNKVKKSIKKQLHHPLRRQLNKICHRFSLYFTILNETIDDQVVEKYNLLKNNPASFYSKLAKVCQLKYINTKSKLWRSAFRSIIYIFLTKGIFALLVELPAIRWFNEELSTATLAINIAFPAILLFIIVLLSKIPGEENTKKIVEGVKEISIQEHKEKEKIILHKPRVRGKTLNTVFHLSYFLCFSFSIYLIYQILDYFNFTWVSILIFLFFLAFVSFFSVRITKGVKELLVVEKKESLVSLLIDLFYMPIIFAGKWLSSNASRMNLFVFIFDFIIEAPFKVLVNVAEDWTRYVKERRDNLS